MKSRKLLSVPIWSLRAQRLWTVQQMWGIFMEGVSVFAVVKLWGGPLGVSKIFLCTVEGCSTTTKLDTSRPSDAGSRFRALRTSSWIRVTSRNQNEELEKVGIMGCHQLDGDVCPPFQQQEAMWHDDIF